MAFANFCRIFRRFDRPFYQRNWLATTALLKNTSKPQTPSIASRIWKSIMSERNGTRRIVGHWLIGTSGLVFGIVVLGGLTRLTESGLSMVDWSVLHFRPPGTQEEWQEYFEKYQQFPEYQINNRGMTLDEFKSIYWFEHAHRVYGRMLGMFIIFPAAFFVAKRWVSPGMRIVLIGCTALVGFQGLLGWYMVKSGLDQEIIKSGEPARVSPYRLTAHLGSALILYLVTLGAGFRILGKKSLINFSIEPSQAIKSRIAKIYPWTHGLAGLTFTTALTGAFVAGLDAGLVYNTFPLMGDRMVPTDIWIEKLSWRNLTENPTTVQFIHRCMAISTITGITSMWISMRKLPIPLTVRRALNLVMGAAWAQGALGVLTLLYMVPIPIASAHQAGSLTLLGSFVWLINSIKRLPK